MPQPEPGHAFVGCRLSGQAILAIMQSLFRDVHYALVTLRRMPGLTLTVLVTLALAVGVTTAVFTVVHAVLLEPLPYADSGQLVRLWEEHPGGESPAGNRWLTLRTRLAWRDESRTIEDAGAYGSYDYLVRQPGFEPSRLHGATVSPSVFRMLRVAPALGRFFVEGEDAAGAVPAVVLSDRVWRDRFGADPATIGRALEIDGERRTIVGIARPDLVFPNPRVLFWIPAAVPVDADQANRTVVFTTLGRLRPGATPPQAEAEGTAVARSLPRPPSTDFFFGRGGAVVVHARPLVDDLTLTVRPAILVLASAVALVLLIACANIANLLLSRGAARERELTIRAALGGSRSRLVRQLLTESLVLSAAGGAAGLALAWTLVRLLPLAAPARFPRLEAITTDRTTMLFGVIASVAAAVISGLVPALRSTRVDLFRALRGGEGSVSASANAAQSRRLRLGLLVVEAAFAVVLAVGASLLAHSFVRLTRVDPGYDPEQVEVMRVQLPEGNDLDVRSDALITRLLERIRATPGVTSAGACNMLPLMPMTAITGVTLPAAVGAGRPTSGRVLSYVVTPGYAEAMQLRLKEGRFFEDRDMTSGERAAIVNQEFVRQFLAGPRAVGVHLGPLYEGESAAQTEIVGVVADVLKEGNDATRQPEMYFVHGSRTHHITGFPTFAVRGTATHAELSATLRRLVREVDAGTAIDSVTPMRTLVSASWGQPRFAASVVSGFAMLAIGLAGIGLYGALSYSVSQRRRELGVRAALGATRGTLVALVLREGVGVTLAGVGIGIVAAGLLSRLMTRLLFGTSPLDALSFSLGPALLVTVGVTASLVPALRAGSIDPAKILRGE
jgi:putative ABC transport system permease protein